MPQIRLRDLTNTVRTVKQIRVRDENNVLRVVKRVRVRDESNFLRTVYSSLQATITPTKVSAYGSSGVAANLTTNGALAIPDGGASPFTYAWAQVGSTPESWTINTPAVASTTFTAASIGAGTVAVATFQVTITDSVGATATATVTAYANNGQPYDPAVAESVGTGSRL